MNELSVSLRIQAIVDGLASIGALIDEIKDMGGESQGAGEMAAVLGKELADLGNKQRIIDQFINLKTAVKDTADQLEVSRAHRPAGPRDQSQRNAQQRPYPRIRKCMGMNRGQRRVDELPGIANKSFLYFNSLFIAG